MEKWKVVLEKEYCPHRRGAFRDPHGTLDDHYIKCIIIKGECTENNCPYKFTSR